MALQEQAEERDIAGIGNREKNRVFQGQETGKLYHKDSAQGQGERISGTGNKYFRDRAC